MPLEAGGSGVVTLHALLSFPVCLTAQSEATQAEYPAVIANVRLPDQHVRAIDLKQLVGEKVMDSRSSAFAAGGGESIEWPESRGLLMLRAHTA